MKEKIIGCSAAGSAIGAGIGAGIGAALSGSIGVPGSVFGAAVIAGAFAAAAAAVCRGRREETLPAPPPAAEAPVKADRQALPAARMQRADVDFLSIAEEMAFASQQLIWGIDQYRAVIAQVEKLAAGISEESETNASNLEEASAGVEEIAASASKISDVATSSLAECKSSTEIAGRCQQVIAQVSQDIQTVAGSVQQGVEEIDELNAASEKIQAFVGKIRGIAAQTNLLALNASIEAARAGEHGRGFAVVAGEVGKLANESDETTQEIEEIVREITTKTATVTERMRAGSEQLGAVEGQAHDSAAAMQGLSRNVSHLEQIVDELTQMSDSQRETTDQMARVVEHVGQATVSIAGNTQEATSSIQGQRRNLEEIHGYAKSLLHVADEVQRAAMQFKQPDEIVFAVNPFTAPETIKETYVPILKDVAARAGKKARTIIVADYEALGEALKNGLADVGWFSPFAYVSAAEKAKLQPLVTPEVNHQTSYTGYIVTKKGSGLAALDDLAGKKFGFVDEESASGYVYPKAALVEAGKDPAHFFGSTVFLGSHNNVIKAVEEGAVDGGATYSTAFAAAHADAQLDIIFRTPPIPTDVIAAAPGMDTALVRRLREEFERTKDTDAACAGAMREAKINGFVETRDAAYDVVRKAAAVQ